VGYCELANCFVVSTTGQSSGYPFYGPTIIDNPVVVDIDWDGVADYIRTGSPGIVVLSPQVPYSWTGTTRIWSQSGYSPENIDEQGFPLLPIASSTFRANRLM